MPTLYLYGVSGTAPLRYEITMAPLDAMALIQQFKEGKRVTNLEAFGGSKFKLIDWKKVPVIEVK